jgi:hypothetical protein
MATQARIEMRAVRTVLGTPVPKVRVPENAAASFKKGALVLVQAADGMLEECGADPSLILGCATRQGQAGGSDGTYSQEVEVAYPGVLFRGYLDTSASEGAGTTAATDRFKQYGVAKNAATGKWYVDKSDTTNDRVVIWEFWDGDGQAVGDIMHHVIFSFLLANCLALLGNN